MGNIIRPQNCRNCELLESRVASLEKKLEEVTRKSHCKETKLKYELFSLCSSDLSKSFPQDNFPGRRSLP